MTAVKEFNSWNSWDPLKEVWLGDVYPESWYEHLDAEVRDAFQEITARTKEDLDVIQKMIESFGVVVQRPVYNNIDDYLDPTDHLIKPSICPRDNYMVYGNSLFTTPDTNTLPWQHVITQYSGETKVWTPDANFRGINGANCVRVGRDLYLDFLQQDCDNRDRLAYRFDELHSLFPDSRLHLLSNGGHIDGCFATLKPGLLMTNHYFDDYAKTFPEWNCIPLKKPTYAKHTRGRPPGEPWHNGNWYLKDMRKNSRAFNSHIEKFATDWVGNYTETYFEVNCLVIDPENVIILGENELVFQELKELGITAHSAPFRCRTFWDGGMHCLTVDSQRSGGMQDYFPDRQDSVYTY